jgi:hypothetical protein
MHAFSVAHIDGLGGASLIGIKKPLLEKPATLLA